MITCTRKLWFSAGHRIYGHESVCAHLHGHNYEVHITAGGDQDSLGRVIEFKVLKLVYEEWLQTHWDHGFIYYTKDQDLCRLFLREEASGFKHWLAPFNPTAENMAKYLLQIGPSLLSKHPLGDGVIILSVKLFETPNCWAEASL